MRKLLLGSAAVALGMSFATGEAQAQVSLEIGGYTQMYGVWLDQDERGDDPSTATTVESVDVRDVDLARHTEIHFTGETTLDNGLTVGFHTETYADGSDTTSSGANDSFNVQESYAYFSGAWGRVNLGAEDGATYLLQVAAPSADTNVDGLRQHINPINHAALGSPGTFGPASSDNITPADLFVNVGQPIGGFVGTGAVSPFAALNVLIADAGTAGASNGDTRTGAQRARAAAVVTRRLDYDHATSGYENKLTYMTPVFNGFQLGASWTPELGSDVNDGVNEPGGSGNNLEDQTSDYGTVWEIAGRWEGQLDQVGIALGGGYSHSELEQKPAVTGAAPCAAAVFYTDLNGSGTCTAVDSTADIDDREAWNVGVDLDWKAFGLGAIYTEDDNGVSGDALETETWAIGLDYTTGPFKIGGSYLTQDQAFGGAEMEADRWTGGVIYTYGPGMTFRGSVAYTEYEEDLGTRTAARSDVSSEADATQLMLGTQINF